MVCLHAYDHYQVEEKQEKQTIDLLNIGIYRKQLTTSWAALAVPFNKLASRRTNRHSTLYTGTDNSIGRVTGAATTGIKWMIPSFVDESASFV